MTSHAVLYRIESFFDQINIESKSNRIERFSQLVDQKSNRIETNSIWQPCSVISISSNFRWFSLSRPEEKHFCVGSCSSYCLDLFIARLPLANKRSAVRWFSEAPHWLTESGRHLSVTGQYSCQLCPSGRTLSRCGVILHNSCQPRLMVTLLLVPEYDHRSRTSDLALGPLLRGIDFVVAPKTAQIVQW